MSTANNMIAQTWFQAFNEHCLEKLLLLYHDDALHYSPKLKSRHPETNGLISGKEALQQWWQSAFLRWPTLQYEVLSITSNESRVFMEYIRHVEGEDDLQVGEVLEINNQKITASRVYHS